MTSTFQIIISGTVQGVGFRPFVYNLAVQFNLKGYVSNNEFGAVIVIQENEKMVLAFLNEIRKKRPKKARINKVQISEITTNEIFDSFFIKPTEKGISVNAPLTPDFAICENCKEEILDPHNRRYFYPFTSCTCCGPRYAIAEHFPFERENTSMHNFKMCKSCQKEYHDPKDIRFHSQTNSCPECGIQITFTDHKGAKISGTNKAIFETIAEKLNQGKIIAVKNTSGYMLLCDASNTEAIQELRKRKRRPKKPFAILFSNVQKIENQLFCDSKEKSLLQSAEAPIVILPLKNHKDLAVSEIAPNMKTIGAMLPNSGILHLICSLFQKPLVATSGNFNGSPLFTDQNEAFKSLHSTADFFLHHNLEILNSQDDSVIRFSRKNKQKIILRQARGFAPNIDNLHRDTTSEKVLCLGAALKNTITISLNQQVYKSEYIGDLFNYDTYNRFEKKIKSYSNYFDFDPKTLIYDLHPGYENNNIISDFLKENPDLNTIEVQHHEAHFAALLSEKRLWKKPRIMGVIWDGNGFGSENEIYGGEFFTYNRGWIKRIGHVDYFSWILGDQMAKNPKMAALSISKNNKYFQSFFNKNELNIYSKLIKRNLIKTSSMGRLIDAVAFTLGFKDEVSFEGQTAMYLENLAQEALNTRSNLKLKDYLNGYESTTIIPSRKILSSIVRAFLDNVDPNIIAINFYFTLVKCIEKAALFSRSKAIAFSGGVFQNSVLIDLLIDHLSARYILHFHEILSPNDENISFGQLNHYLHIKNKRWTSLNY